MLFFIIIFIIIFVIITCIIIIVAVVIISYYHHYYYYFFNVGIILDFIIISRPGSSEVPCNPLTRWDVSSIPANGVFLTKKQKN